MYIRSHVMMIHVHIKFKFNEVLIIGYLDMANFMDFKSVQRLELMHYSSHRHSDET